MAWKKGERMGIERRRFTGLMLATPLAIAGARGASAQDDEALAYYRQAKINWRQAERGKRVAAPPCGFV